MKFEKIHPTEEETYEIAFDDGCIVVKSGDDKIWISKQMAHWLSQEFLKND